MLAAPAALGLYAHLGDLAQAAAAFVEHRHTQLTTWEFSIRRLPDDWNYLVFAGLGTLLEQLPALGFAPEQLEFLRYHPAFASVPLSWLEHLSTLRFTGDVWSMPEGTVCFANTPLVRIIAPFDLAAITGMLITQTLLQQMHIASQVSRYVTAVAGRALIDHSTAPGSVGISTSIATIRAAYLAGILSTTHAEASRQLQIPGQVLLPEAWMQWYSEETALRAFANNFSSTCIPVMACDAVEAGVRAALAARIPLRAIHLAGDGWKNASQTARRLLDQHGRKHVKILAEATADEQNVARQVEAGAPVDGLLLDTCAIHQAASPLQGVYKIVAHQDDALRWHPARPFDTHTLDYPWVKQVYRQTHDDGSFAGDSILHESEPSQDEPLLHCAMQQGRVIARLPSLAEARDYCTMQRIRLPLELHSLTAAKQVYPVRYSELLLTERMRFDTHR